MEVFQNKTKSPSLSNRVTNCSVLLCSGERHSGVRGGRGASHDSSAAVRRRHQESVERRGDSAVLPSQEGVPALGLRQIVSEGEL